MVFTTLTQPLNCLKLIILNNDELYGQYVVDMLLFKLNIFSKIHLALIEILYYRLIQFETSKRINEHYWHTLLV